MKRKSKKIFPIIVISVGFLFVFVVVGLFSIFLFNKFWFEQKDEIEGFGNENSIGYFLSDTNEYRCDGSCWCGSVNERRNSFAISRGIIHLVAATTAVIALKKAETHFKESCKVLKKDLCPEGFVKAEVDSCENVELSSEENDIGESDLVLIRRYTCEGKCLQKRFKRSDTKLLAKRAGCERMEKKSKIEIDCKKVGAAKCYQYARVKFQQDILAKFCKARSLTEYFYQKPPNNNGTWKEISVCSATNGTTNPTIRCKQTWPKDLRLKKEGKKKQIKDQ